MEKRADAAEVQKNDGSGPRKYAFRYKLLGVNGRHISIATNDSTDHEGGGTRAGITVYINLLSRRLEPFPVTFTERSFPSVTVTKQYPKGTKGYSGDKGLSSAAASCATLDPYDNDVLRLSVADEQGFKRLLEWYAGDKSLQELAAAS